MGQKQTWDVLVSVMMNLVVKFSLEGNCADSDVYSPALTTNSAKPEIERHMAFVTQREDSTGNEISLRFEFVSCSLASG